MSAEGKAFGNGGQTGGQKFIEHLTKLANIIVRTNRTMLMTVISGLIWFSLYIAKK